MKKARVLKMNRAGFLILFTLLFGLPAWAQETAEDLYKKGSLLKKENNCAEALGVFQKAVALKPSFGEAWFEIGWCQNELGSFKEAVLTLRKAGDLLPANYRVSYETGHAFYYLDSARAALRYFQESVKLKPDYNLPYTGIGDVFSQKLGNTKEGLKWYLKSYTFDSLHLKTLFNIGWCYNDLGQNKEAIQYLEKLITLDKTNTEAIAELGFSLYTTKNYERALVILQPAVAAKNDLALYYAGLSYVRLNQKGEAIKKYNELTLLGSEHALDLLAEIKAMK